MKIFGREPTLVLQSISALLSVLVSVGFGSLTSGQAGLIVAAISAVFAAVNALKVRPISPAVFIGAVGAVAALVSGFGLELSPQFVGSVSGALVALLALLTRGQVTPTDDPQPTSQDQEVA